MKKRGKRIHYSLCSTRLSYRRLPSPGRIRTGDLKVKKKEVNTSPRVTIIAARRLEVEETKTKKGGKRLRCITKNEGSES